jgi:hypothetical protein
VEYDTSLTKHQTDFANEIINLDRNRAIMLKQQLEGSGSELDLLRVRFEDKKVEIDRCRGEVGRLIEQLTSLKNEFDNESMARVMIQNELSSLGTLSIDVTQFYRAELTRAIAEIKSDFDMLAKAQRQELEG